MANNMLEKLLTGTSGETSGNDGGSEDSDEPTNASVSDSYDEDEDDENNEQAEKNRELETEYIKEEEVRAAYQALLQAEKENTTTTIQWCAHQKYRLFCVDHVQHCFRSWAYSTKRIEFSGFDAFDHWGTDDSLAPWNRKHNENDPLCGMIYLSADAYCYFGAFHPPRHASRNTVKLKSEDAKYELSVQFIGNEYLKLNVPKEVVFLQRWPTTVLSDAPKIFEFFGIRRDIAKEKAGGKARREIYKPPPSPSTESW